MEQQATVFFREGYSSMGSTTRRSFVKTAAAVAATLAGRWTQAATATNPKLGLQLYSLRTYSFDDAVRHAKDLGFETVEFYAGMFPISEDAVAIAQTIKKVTDLGLTISAHGVNRFTADREANRKIFSFAKLAGIGTITADPLPESFPSLEELVKEFDVRIAIHNHGPGHRYSKVIDVLRAIENCDERIGACADLGHYIRSAERPAEVIRLLKGRLYGIHLKDFADMKKQTKGVILGRGHLDLPAVFAALEQVQFPPDGALSLEYEENPKNPINDIRQCVAAARAAMA
jgi:inosose dehydratase